MKSDFVPGTLVQMEKSYDLGVVAIGGVYLDYYSISDVQTSWKDDAEKMCNSIIKGTLYFSNLPGNMLSVTALMEQLDDNIGTWTKTSYYELSFTWDEGKVTKKIVHPAS